MTLKGGRPRSKRGILNIQISTNIFVVIAVVVTRSLFVFVFRYNELEKAGVKIHALLHKNSQMFNANRKSKEWKKYTEYVDKMVLQGFWDIINCSLQYLLSNTCDGQVNPLFEAKLLLQEQQMQFDPSLELGDSDGFLFLFDNLTLDIYRQATCIDRLFRKGAHHDYMVCLFIHQSCDTWFTVNNYEVFRSLIYFRANSTKWTTCPNCVSSSWTEYRKSSTWYD